MSKEAMKLALEALKQIDEAMPFPVAKFAQAALREALAEQPAQQVVDCHATGVCVQSGLRAEQPAQQEPVAWPCLIEEADFSADTVTLAMQCTDYKVSAGEHWLSNTPPAQRTWVGLTDEEVEKLTVELRDIPVTLAFAIEAKLKEKNT